MIIIDNNCTSKKHDRERYIGRLHAYLSINSDNSNPLIYQGIEKRKLSWNATTGRPGYFSGCAARRI